MTTTVRHLKLERHLAERAAGRASELSITPVIGKDILEVVSSAMYVDPRVVFREYIQNAADAIEEAYEAGALDEASPGRIDVSVDLASRTLSIRDNGVGIVAADASRVLTALGASAKRGTPRRGFRGIGRFAGLGYAQQVSFITKASGESEQTEIRWDCRKLKSALADMSYQGDVTRLIQEAVTVYGIPDADVSASFFEVRLERVVRIKNDILLNVEEVERYLSEVGPVPFAPNFALGKDITDRLKPFIGVPRFSIYLNGADQPISRPHRTEFLVGKNRTDAASSVDVLVLADSDGKIRAIVWLLHHGYQGALHGSPEIRGLRARVGDMQIGDDTIFLDVFREPRFNSWTIGEVHVLDRKIVPNARRDGFEQNASYSDLIAQLAPIARDLGKRCRASSSVRHKLRGFATKAALIEELVTQLNVQALTKQREARIRSELRRLTSELDKISISRDLNESQQSNLRGRLRRLRTMLAEAGSDVQRLEAMPEELAPLYRDLVEILSDSIPNKTSARTLIDRLTTRFALETKRSKKKPVATHSRKARRK